MFICSVPSEVVILSIISICWRIPEQQQILAFVSSPRWNFSSTLSNANITSQRSMGKKIDLHIFWGNQLPFHCLNNRMPTHYLNKKRSKTQPVHETMLTSLCQETCSTVFSNYKRSTIYKITSTSGSEKSVHCCEHRKFLICYIFQGNYFTKLTVILIV